jgi:4'-phosphopantetheinyl transferase
MKSKLPHAELGLPEETGFLKSMVWLGEDPAIALFEDRGALEEKAAFGLLSPDEQSNAGAILDATERRHFVFRRCFQRCFLKSITRWPGSSGELEIIHARDTRPSCTAFPEYSLSFSSSGTISIAAASRISQIGVDIERVRAVWNCLELAARFFHADETAYLATVPEKRRDAEFLTFWTIKEACLKAIGKGIIHGLDGFLVTSVKNGYRIVPPVEFGVSSDWGLEFPPAPAGHILAVVHNKKT